jgi:hypothetical protein
MTELNIKAGDEIRYTSAAGRLRARVDSITVGATAKAGHSIAWLNLKVYGFNDRFKSTISIPADANSLKMFKVEVI